MNSAAIETFLTAVAYGTISEAAERLYISQGTASARIAQLEEELGVTLFSRHRGIKAISLTAEGREFLPIAKQYQALDNQASQIRHAAHYRELRIASIDTLNSFLFPGIYAGFSEHHCSIRLYLQTEHSTEIHQLIEHQAIDIGFAGTLHASKNVLSRPILQEDMVILCHEGSPFAMTHDESDLSDADEIRSEISPGFSAWHRSHFPRATERLLTVGTWSLLPSFIGQEGAWTIASTTVAHGVQKKVPGLAIVPFSHDAPPRRMTYYLSYRYPEPWIQEAGEAFVEEIRRHFEGTPYLDVL